ncbi:MAG: hypothetical protein QM820_06825 [Minicystis sp.]
MARETEGNTYFVVEAMRALAEESGGLAGIGRRSRPEQILAGGMDWVFARRLARAPAEARSLLCLAAVAGRQLDLDVLSRCVPRLDDLVRSCTDAGVLEVHEQRFRFSHDKLRERVIGALDAAELRALHARVAEGIEAAYPDSDAQAARLAHHHHAAGQLTEAARWYARAGEAALARGAPAEAEAMLEQARRIHARIGAPGLADLRVWRGLAEARFALGRLTETHEAVQRVCALAGAPLPSSAPGFLRAIGRQAAEQVARRAGLARLLPLDPRSAPERARRAQLLLGLSVNEVYVWLIRPEMLLLCTLWGLNLEEALDARERTNFRAAMAFVLSYTPLRGLSRRYLDRAAATAAAGTHAEIDHLRVQALIQLNAGSWTEAADSAARAVSGARAQRDDHSLMQSLLQLQLAQGELDDYAGMIATCREMERLATRAQNPRYAALGLLGQGHGRFRLGELAEAEVLLDRVLASLPQELGPITEAVAVSLAAACALRLGRPARAEALAARAMGAARRVRGTMAEIRYALAGILEVYLSADHPARHEAEIRSALAEMHRIARRFPFAEPNAWKFQGRYDSIRARPAPAAEALRRSACAAERLGARYQHAHARLWLGHLARTAAGRPHVPEGALPHLQAALAVFDHLGCAYEAAQARAALRDAVT